MANHTTQQARKESKVRLLVVAKGFQSQRAARSSILPSELLYLQANVHAELHRRKTKRADDILAVQCDIDAISADDYCSAEAECKQLVVEAGGIIDDRYLYLGGFLFQLPPGTDCPIETGDVTALGGTITVQSWAFRSINSPGKDSDRVVQSPTLKSPCYATWKRAGPASAEPSPTKPHSRLGNLCPEVMRGNENLLTEMLLEESWRSRLQRTSGRLQRTSGNEDDEDDDDWETVREGSTEWEMA